MLKVENLSKGYGARTLFEDINFTINPGEKVGLTGRNGHGKTTLFRILTGEEQPDEGSITMPGYYRLGYVQQNVGFSNGTVLEEVMRGLPEDEMHSHWKAEKILSGLGFTETGMGQKPEIFSGGFQVRMQLARAIVSEPNLLLLDEPTNYLDITSIRWLVRFLKTWPYELMLITHDRRFMDSVINHTIGIHRQKVRKVEGNTEKLYTQLALEEEVYEKTRVNDERKKKEVEQFINRFRAKARLANMVQSRIKSLEKMEKRDRLEKIKTLDFAFREKPHSGKFVMTANNITFGYVPDKPVIKDFSISITARDRICIVGPNGRGKTTLLKLLGEKLHPQAGSIVTHPQMETGYFEQTNIKELVDTRTVEEEILSAGGDMDRQLARNICGAMLFENDDALKKIEILSGGEKSRVMIGKILAHPVNLLLLDEPTNHLDMESSDALLAAIDSFDGAVVMVTHNEMFLDALAQRLILFQGEKVSVFEGDYESFLDKIGWDEEADQRKKDSNDSENQSSQKINRKDVRKVRSDIITRRAKTLKPIESKMKKIENRIMELEGKLEELNNQMIEASAEQNGSRISTLSQENHSTQEELDGLYDELDMLMEKRDSESRNFQEELDNLDQ